MQRVYLDVFAVVSALLGVGIGVAGEVSRVNYTLPIALTVLVVSLIVAVISTKTGDVN